MTVQVGRWRKTVKLKDLLSLDDSDENVRRVAKAMSDRLKRQKDYEEDGYDDFSQTVDDMAQLATCADDEHDGGYTLCDHFNDCMAAIYDWADAERVWIA